MQVELPGCKGIWTVYHKNARGHNADFSKVAADDNEYHAYLIISLEARTMVISLLSYIKRKLNVIAKFILPLSQFKYHALHFGMCQTNVLFLKFEI
jgi:hypothetical protein